MVQYVVGSLSSLDVGFDRRALLGTLSLPPLGSPGAVTDAVLRFRGAFLGTGFSPSPPPISTSEGSGFASSPFFPGLRPLVFQSLHPAGQSWGLHHLCELHPKLQQMACQGRQPHTCSRPTLPSDSVHKQNLAPLARPNRAAPWCRQGAGSASWVVDGANLQRLAGHSGRW